MHHGLGREEDGGEGNDQGQAGHDGVAIAVPLAHPAIDHQADDLADSHAVGQAGLPGGRDLVGAVGQLVAVLLVELGEAVEVGQQAHVVALHGDAGADEERPADGLGVQLQALPQAHGVLLLGRLARVVDDLVGRLLVLVFARDGLVHWADVLFVGHGARSEQLLAEKVCAAIKGRQTRGRMHGAGNDSDELLNHQNLRGRVVRRGRGRVNEVEIFKTAGGVVGEERCYLPASG